MRDKNKFNFWFPIEIEKAKGENGKENMGFKGVASTFDEDTDGEFLDPKGFDLTYLKKSGFLNWHHSTKERPKAIIGEPTKAEITSKGLYVETKLYDSPMAREVFELGELLEKNSKTRRLGFSVEGKVTERDPLNEKIIRKANITGIAITHLPKNQKTFAEIMKGEIDFIPLEFDEVEKGESANGGTVTIIADVTRKDGSRILLDSTGNITYKALDTADTGKALKKESLEGAPKILTHPEDSKHQFTKAELFEKIFNDFSAITFEKAQEIYSEIINQNNKTDMKTKEKEEETIELTEDVIQKAYEILGLTRDEDEEIEKGEKEEEIEDEDEEKPKKKIEKCDASLKKGENKKKVENEEEEDEKEIEKSEEPDETEEEEDEDEKPKKKEVKDKKIEKAQNDDLGKNEVVDIVKAVGVVLSDVRKEFKKGLEEMREELFEKIDEIGAQPNPRKSMMKAQERFKEDHPNAISLSQNKGKILNILDSLTFEGDKVNETFAKGMTMLESSGQLPGDVISALKAKGFDIVQ